MEGAFVGSTATRMQVGQSHSWPPSGLPATGSIVADRQMYYIRSRVVPGTPAGAAGSVRYLIVRAVLCSLIIGYLDVIF